MAVCNWCGFTYGLETSKDKGYMHNREECSEILKVAAMSTERARCARWADQFDSPEAKRILIGIDSGKVAPGALS